MSGRFSVKLLAVVAALSLMGSGVAVADETTNPSDVPGVDVSVPDEASVAPEEELGIDSVPSEDTEAVADNEETSLPSEETVAPDQESNQTSEVEEILDDEAGADTKNVIPDKAFRQCINSVAFGLSVDDARGITATQLKKVTGILRCPTDREVASLEGVQYLTNIWRLDVQVENDNTLAPLAKMKSTKLKELLIDGDYTQKKKIKMPDLSGLTKLEKIDFFNIPLSDISGISGAKNLRDVDLSYCNITNPAPLAKLPKVEKIDLFSNDIKDISSLANIKTLTYLNLSNNKLTSIPKRTVTGQSQKPGLSVGGNYIKNFKNGNTWRISGHQQDVSITGIVKGNKTRINSSSLFDDAGKHPKKAHLAERDLGTCRPLEAYPGTASKNGKAFTFSQRLKSSQLIYLQSDSPIGWCAKVKLTFLVDKVSISGASKVMAGTSITLKSTVTPSNASNKAVSWKSSNTKVATVDANGKVTASKSAVGKTVTITAVAKDGSGTKASKTITVTKPVKVTKVSISGVSKVTAGTSITLKASVAPSNATDKAVSWKSSNTKIATVDARGKVTAKNPGTVTITATAKDGSKKKASKKIIVTEAVQKMYRLYNRVSHEHLYTADAHERDVLRKGDWNYEGIGWVAPKKSKTPVYRLYNPVLGDHHYTTDTNEVKTLTKKHGWRKEGIGWYSDDKKRVKVYRQFNPGLRVGSHNYTADLREYKINNARNGWRGEGVAWYAVRLK